MLDKIWFIDSLLFLKIVIEKGEEMEERTISNREDLFSFEMPPARHIQQIIDAGNRSPFISHFYSIFLSRRASDNLMKAPLEFIVCADIYRVSRIFEKKGKLKSLDIKSLFSLAMQNAQYAANNMVLQAQLLDLHTEYTPMTYKRAEMIIKDWNIPEKVVPLVTLSIGYPEIEPPKPSPFPNEFLFFEDEYPAANDFLVDELMFHLGQENDLLEYYKQIENTGASEAEKSKWTWFDLLSNSAIAWKKVHSEFKKITELCGVEF